MLPLESAQDSHVTSSLAASHFRWCVLLQPQTALLSATLVNQLKGTVSSGMACLLVPW